MTRAALVLALLLALPALAGCFSPDEPAAAPAAVAANAEAAGAVSGPAPAAPREAYQVAAQDEGAAPITAYPVTLRTNAPKAPYVQEFKGTFEPQDCNPSGGVPVGGFGLAQPTDRHDVSEAIGTLDVFSFDVSASYVNTEQSWASLHLWYQFDQKGNYWNAPTEAAGEVAMNFTGQGFAVSEEPTSFIGIDCWFGQVTSPIAYTIQVTITFAEGGVPAETPFMLDVPAEATSLIVRGVALDPEQGVLSHYRVFGPDDALVCECALGSGSEVAIHPLGAGAGKYVILVDHTTNGFVSLALDAASPAELQPLQTEFVTYPILSNPAGNAVDETISVDLPSTPLSLWAWVAATGDWNGPPDAGAGRGLRITASNARGEVLRIAMVGYATYHAAAPGTFTTNDWYAVPVDGEWEFYVDHHAYDLGPHDVRVTAEQLRGDVVMYAQHYVRA